MCSIQFCKKEEEVSNKRIFRGSFELIAFYRTRLEVRIHKAFDYLNKYADQYQNMFVTNKLGVRIEEQVYLVRFKPLAGNFIATCIL